MLKQFHVNKQQNDFSFIIKCIDKEEISYDLFVEELLRLLIK